MIQIYLLVEIYLFLASGIILSDNYGASFLLLFNLRALYESRKIYRLLGAFTGLLLIILMCLFPISPGPLFIGDLLPEIAVLLVVIRVLLPSDSTYAKNTSIGILCFITAIIHFLVPSLVIL